MEVVVFKTLIWSQCSEETILLPRSEILSDERGPMVLYDFAVGVVQSQRETIELATRFSQVNAYDLIRLAGNIVIVIAELNRPSFF